MSLHPPQMSLSPRQINAPPLSSNLGVASLGALKKLDRLFAKPGTGMAALCLTDGRKRAGPITCQPPAVRNDGHQMSQVWKDLLAAVKAEALRS